jgi:hypothetical protein
MLAPLQLKGTQFRSIEIRINDEFQTSEDTDLSLNTQVQVFGLADENSSDETSEDISVELRLLNDSSADNFQVTFDIVIVGSFSLHGILADWDRVEKLKLLKRNGAALLYSQFREMFLYLTARTTGTPIQMPTVSPSIFDDNESVKNKKVGKKKVGKKKVSKKKVSKKKVSKKT